MAKLKCEKCRAEQAVPKIHDGPGVLSKTDPTKLVCPTHGDHCCPTDIPKHCGVPMKYVQ